MGLCTELFMLSSLPCFYDFCWSAIPTDAADACLSWSLPSITEQQVCPHRLPMQYWLKNHWPDQAFFKHSPHTNYISNSAISHENRCYVICVYAYMWRKNGIAKEAIVFSERFEPPRETSTWKKAMGWCTAQWKMLLFCPKPSWKSHTNLNACLKKRRRRRGGGGGEGEEEEDFGCLATFWFGWA